MGIIMTFLGVFCLFLTIVLFWGAVLSGLTATVAVQLLLTGIGLFLTVFFFGIGILNRMIN